MDRDVIPKPLADPVEFDLGHRERSLLPRSAFTLPPDSAKRETAHEVALRPSGKEQHRDDHDRADRGHLAPAGTGSEMNPATTTGIVLALNEVRIEA